ncbi:MAG TPA: hypothetical protein VNA04_01125 [Thermoanaerobaculia bacterium]|nr:hypothetical protein [Thermoanaerobaculia bacterium]
MTGWMFIATLFLAGVAFLLLSGSLRTWLRFRGTRVITCPENLRPAAVKVDAMHAAKWMAIAGETNLNLRACSRWPEMAGCAQDCLAQVEKSPEACLLASMVTRWYEGKACAYCRQPIGTIVWHERPPALRSPSGTTREWKEFRPEDLPQVFATHQAVCWPCHIRESFRREHPDLVVERPRPREIRPVLEVSTAVY